MEEAFQFVFNINYWNNFAWLTQRPIAYEDGQGMFLIPGPQQKGVIIENL